MEETQDEKVQKAIEVLSSLQGQRQSVPRDELLQPQRPSGSRNAGRSCSRAVQAIRSIRDRLGHSSTSATAEQRQNFAPYSASGRRQLPKKVQSWTVRVFCLSERECKRIPTSGYTREALVAAGLGERKIVIPNIESDWDDFKSVLITEFPKLASCGGFEFMRCIPNSKELEAISVHIAQSPKLLKSVIGSGRVFVRPIQQDLALDDSGEKSKIKEKCILCQKDVLWTELRTHVQACKFQRMKTDTDSSSDSDFEQSASKVTKIYISSSDEEPEQLKTSTASSQATATMEFPITSGNDAVETESVMLEHALSVSRSQSESTSERGPVTMGRVIAMLSGRLQEDYFLMEIRRGHELDDAMRSMKRAIFSPTLKLQVKFVGECAEDGGGPTREFWAGISKQVRNLFLGTGDSGILTHDAIGLQRKKFLYIGQLMAMSLTQQGSGFPYIAKPVYDYLCGADPSEITAAIEDVADWEVVAFINEVNEASDDKQLREVCLKGIDTTLEAGYTLPVASIDMGGKPELIKTICLHHTILRNKAVLDQLKDGLSALGVLQAMANYPKILEDFFIAGKQKPLVADTIKQLLETTVWSEVGTTQRAREESTYMLFLDLLHECEDDVCPEVTLTQILSFFTGSEYPPPLGFDGAPCLRFSSSTDFPLASTCALELTLPSKYHDNPALFREKMIYGLKNHGGFGLL